MFPLVGSSQFDRNARALKKQLDGLDAAQLKTCLKKSESLVGKFDKRPQSRLNQIPKKHKALKKFKSACKVDDKLFKKIGKLTLWHLSELLEYF